MKSPLEQKIDHQLETRQSLMRGSSRDLLLGGASRPSPERAPPTVAPRRERPAWGGRVWSEPAGERWFGRPGLGV